MASMQLLLLFLTFSFTVFAQELDTLPPSSPHYPHPHSHPPTPAPAPAPHHHHHHHHHHHPPAAAPVHPPTPPHHYPPPPTPTPSPAKPPVHHYPPTHTPTHPHYPPPPTPTPSPAKPPVHHHYPPTHTPTHPHYPPPPSPAPVPAKPPSHPPLHPFPRSFVAVQGVVYCKSCKYAGVDTLLGATPSPGAVVKLQCNNTKYPAVQTAKTDKNGYFYLEAPKRITTFGAHKCRLYLVSSPNATCQKPSNLHGGIVGATLRPEKPFVSYKLPFLLYTVGPLAFEPKCPHY